jgi:hypothetical protein
MMNSYRTLLICAILAAAGGCNTYVTTDEGADFNTSVKDVAEKLKASLSEIQSVEVANGIDAYAKGGQRRLEQLDIAPKLSDAEVKAITSQFDFLVSYSEALKEATAPGGSWAKSVSGVDSAEKKAVGDTQGLDNKYTGRTVITNHNVKSFDSDADGVANAVSSIGEDALTLYGGEKASRIAAVVDPALQKYCADLEAILAEEPASKAPQTGLAGILQADYEERIASVKYLATTAAPPSGPDDPNYFALVQQRTAILNEYTGLLGSEKTGLANVRALRKAVAEIALAHGALAKKDDATFKEKLTNAEDLVRSVAAGAPASPDASAK